MIRWILFSRVARRSESMLLNLLWQDIWSVRWRCRERQGQQPPWRLARFCIINTTIHTYITAESAYVGRWPKSPGEFSTQRTTLLLLIHPSITLMSYNNLSGMTGGNRWLVFTMHSVVFSHKQRKFTVRSGMINNSFAISPSGWKVSILIGWEFNGKVLQLVKTAATVALDRRYSLDYCS